MTLKTIFCGSINKCDDPSFLSFTRHKDTAFFERLSDKCFMHPWKFRFVPLLHKLRKIRRGKNFRPNALEGSIWRRFFIELDYLDESNVTPEIKNYYYSAIKAELSAFKAKRFVNKNPADCLRLIWINVMFPDAYYVIIWRDSKAVVNSIYKKMLRKWNYELIHGYEHGYHGYVTVKEKFGKDVTKIEACINFYNYLKKNLVNDLKIIENRKTEIVYENLIVDTRHEMKRLFEFTGLEWYPDLEKIIPEKLELINNEKWKELNKNEKELLEKHLK